MNGNSRNQDNSDDGNRFVMKKTTYWEINGVKRFPYRGRRKYTPLLHQSLDGGMIIWNDVFGLTIRQFERVYKACLERRKTKEQWILNLRYPDKSSNAYLEYLENCTDFNKGHLLWWENHQREKNLYEHLVKTVGTEIDIRTRQRLFIIQDMIVNACLNKTQISSGSLAEGLDLPGSDMDIMFVNDFAHVIHNKRNIKHPIHNNIFVMETDIDYPGFTKLRLVARHDKKSIKLTCFNCPPGSCRGNYYLGIHQFLNALVHRYPNLKGVIHGPCISNKEHTIDIAECLHSKYLPDNAIPWASRHRLQWPPNFVIDKIINYGCLLVPIGPKTIPNNCYLWRLSFSMAEKILVHSFNFTQLLCYGLLKLSLKRIVNTNDDAKDLLCSYFLKTALFWVSEEVDIDTFQLTNLYYCFSLCLEKLISWVNTCYCPNYFIPEHNMFLGKINQTNNTILLHVLDSIQCGGIDGLLHSLFPPDNENHRLLGTYSESTFILLDFLLYRNTCYTIDTISKDISSCYKALSCSEYLLKSESSTFIIDVCKYYKNIISKEIANLLPPPNTMDNNIRKCYHKLFKHITKIDAVSGWLLYASVYYVTRQFNVTLRITDYVLSKWSPYLMFIDSGVNSDIQKINYRQNVHSSMTLNEKLSIATAQHVHYRKHTSLIPEELQLEVESGMMNILPDVMSHCLRFLCYHHLGDISNRRQALRDLYIAVKYNYVSLNTISNALTILGVCCEISGHKDMAYQCFDEAMQCDDYVCPSAETRQSKLFEI
ncbi:uncharacterized protein LOC127718330 [Mytilus californianus]|uniref:uncharacterized protein LOC127718330 n=1 Tax=Mytilus californianus TaxID=6549 RepID=UPI0022464C5A|nr:uncharacterized protein LOC127718330 [Mytilus californianus]